MTARSRPDISIVVPCYGCESCLRALYDELVEVLAELVGDFEIVLVDDRSKQGDWGVISELATLDPRVRGVRLNRNFGQHAAIAAGLEFAEGDWVVVMDCDLQDPPKAIGPLHATAREGWPVVFARRRNRKDKATKRLSSAAFSIVHGWLAGFEADPSVGNFSIISRNVVLELRRLHERNRNYGMQLAWLGYETAFVDIEHQARHSGTTTYTLTRQLIHAMNTILTGSTRPLYASTIVGFVFSALATLYALYLVLRKLITDRGVEGWTSVMVSLFFLSGILMILLGVLGLYLGNVFLEVKGRPNFVVDATTFERAEPRSKGRT